MIQAETLTDIGLGGGDRGMSIMQWALVLCLGDPLAAVR